MKAIGIFLTLLVISYETGADQLKAFEEGKRYVYEYKTQVLTGVTEGVKQLSGFAFTSLLTVQNDGSQISYQMSDLKYVTINDRLDPFADVSADYERLPDERVVHVDNLEKPFWVDYDHGLIKAIYFTKGEDVAKHNNKKALASIFQLYLEGEDISDPLIFTKKEESITGVCDSMYMVNVDEKDTTFNVTKIRQMDSCEKSPYLFYSTFQGNLCEECQWKPLRSTASVEYFLKGTRSQYIIEHITAVGEIDLTPFTTKGQSVLSTVKQTFDLMKVEADSSIEKPSDLDKHEHLHYEFNNDFRGANPEDLKEPHYFNRVYPFTDSSHISKATDLYKKMEEECKLSNPNIVQYVPDFIDILSEFSYDEFVDFFDKRLPMKKPDRTLSSLLQMIPKVGTNPAILYAFHVIEEGKVNVKQAAQMIQSIPFYVKEPSENLLNLAKKFGLNSLVVNEYNLYISSRLAYGTLLYKACEESIFNPHPYNSKTFISEEKCKEYVQELMEQFKKASNDTERLLYLRTLLNVRSQSSNKFIISIIKGNYSNILREVAVWDLDYTTPEETVQAVEALTSVLFNPKEDFVLRMHAFETRGPTTGGIVKLLKEDPSEELKSYIYRFLTAYMNNPIPSSSFRNENMKRMVQLVEERKPDIMKEAFDINYIAYNGRYALGKVIHLAVTPGPDSLFPRVIFFIDDYKILGHSFGYEFGYMAQGRNILDDILSNLVGPTLSHYVMPPRFSEEFVTKAYEKFKEYKESVQRNKPYQIIFAQYGQDVYFTDDLERFVEKEFPPSEVYFKEKKTLIDINVVDHLSFEMLIPNELGMPLSVKSQIPTAKYFRGTISNEKKKGDDGSSIGEETTFDLNLGIQMEVQSQVAVLSVLFGPLGFKMTTKSGLSFPIRVIQVDEYKTRRTFWKYIPSVEPYDLYQYESVPETIGKNSLKIHYSDTPVRKQFSFGHDYLGFGFTFNLTYDRQDNDFNTLSDFFKSLIKKPLSYEKYHSFWEKYHAATGNLGNYLLFNPKAKPIAFNVRYSPSSTNPTTEFDFSATYNTGIYPTKDNQAAEKDLSFKSEIIGKGSVERKWKIELGYESSLPDKNVRKSYFHFKRSPLPDYDAQSFEFCYFSNISLADLQDIYHLKASDVNLIYKNYMSFGHECDKNNPDVSTRIVLQQSEEQKSLDRDNLPFYKRCHEQIASNPSSLTPVGNIHKDCWEVIKDLARLDRIKIDIDFKNTTNNVKNSFLRLADYFRYRFYNQLQDDSFQETNLNNKVQIDAQVDYRRPVLDAKITTPYNTALFKDIDILSFFPQFEPISVAERWKDRLFRMFLDYRSPFCYLSGDLIRTFDDVTYEVSLTKEFHLTVSDLDFIFLFFRKVENGKAIYAHISGLTVEIAPHEKDLEVKINGKLALQDGIKIYIHREQERILAVVYKYGDGIMLEDKINGWELYFDGNNSLIRGSYIYKGRLCGICGNLNNEKMNEFQGSDGTVYENPSDFINSYIVEHGNV